MKIIYSHLKKLLPGLKEPARQLAKDFTAIGHFCSGFQKIAGQEIIDLEIRHNRGDCFGYFGLAKELAVLYDLPLSLPQINITQPPSLPPTPVNVKSKTGVKRLMAVVLTDIKNHSSPDWLRTFLKLHEVNSLNLLVDLTNYIMLYWGLPCHAFDLKKLTGDLVWQDSLQKRDFITFDQTKLQIAGGTLEIVSKDQTVSLTFIGGQNSGIDLHTQETLIEMAVYDSSRVRKDSQLYKVITEASTRLEKFLDPELIPLAFAHLINLINRYCHGKIGTQIYDYYPHPQKPVSIAFNPQKPSLYAGINIPSDFALKTLEHLNCQIKKGSKETLVQVPSLRKDINLEEDLIEEVIRFWGYQKIPRNQPLPIKKIPDITPPVLYLIEHLRKILTDLGYDEIRSWPLLAKKLVNSRNAHVIYTQNNINSNFPALRTSIIPSLKLQQEQYKKYKVSPIQIFEIGKIYFMKGDTCQEPYSLAVHHPQKKQLQKDILFLLKSLGLSVKDLKFTKINTDYYYEIQLDTIQKSINPQFLRSSPQKMDTTATAYELKKQIITLDANLNFEKPADLAKLIKKYQNKIGDNYLWQLYITDAYQDPKNKKYRYTFRASYYNLDSKKAKSLHQKAFRL